MEINWIIMLMIVMQFCIVETIFSDHLRTMSILFNRVWNNSRLFPLCLSFPRSAITLNTLQFITICLGIVLSTPYSDNWVKILLLHADQTTIYFNQIVFHFTIFFLRQTYFSIPKLAEIVIPSNGF